MQYGGKDPASRLSLVPVAGIVRPDQTIPGESSASAAILSNAEAASGERLQNKNAAMPRDTAAVRGMENKESVAGGPATGAVSRGLIAVRCGPPSSLNRIYKAIGIAG